MAKLSANGIEIARYRTTTPDDVFGRDVIREYSLRDNGWVLVKVQYGDKSWTGWKRFGCYAGTLAYATNEQRRRHLEIVLAKKGSVEDVTR